MKETLTAVFEELSGEKVGIVRFYKNNPEPKEPDKYEKFTMVILNGDKAFIEGWDEGFNLFYRRSLREELRKLGVKEVSYRHDLKTHVIKI